MVSYYNYNPVVLLNIYIVFLDDDFVLVEGGTFILGEDHPDWDRILPTWAKNNDKREEKVESFYISMIF